MDSTAQHLSVGVQELMEKLRSEGVQSGEEERQKIIHEAEAKADSLIKQAQKKAKALIADAEKQAHFTKQEGNNALQLALRDSIGELKNYLSEQLTQKIRSAIINEFKDPELLKNIIIEIAGKHPLKKEKELEILLPIEMTGGPIDPEQKKNVTKKDILLHFVYHQAQQLLKEGVTFSTHNHDQAHCIIFRVKNKDIEINIDEQAISDIFLTHLQPRFKTLLNEPSL